MFSQPEFTDPPVRGGQQIAKFIDDHGYSHVFAIPGSSMAGFLHAMQNCEAEYVPAIHESVTVAMADGFSRVAGSGLAMLYMLPGVANGLGNIYNAWKDESPLTILASNQSTRLKTPEWTVCEGDLVSMTKPYTRLSHEIAPGMALRPWLDQARRTAMGPLPGPTFLSLQENVIDEPQQVETSRSSQRPAATAPDLGPVLAALRSAERPLIVVGGQLARWNGARAIEELAADQAIPMTYEASFNDRMGAAPGHPNMFGNIIGSAAPMEQDADVVLVIGARFMAESHVRPLPWFPKARFIAHINADPAKLEATQSADFAAACDPGAAAATLRDALAIDGAPAETRQRRSNWMQAVRDSGPNGFLPAISHYLDAVAPLTDALDHGWLVDESTLAIFALQERMKATDGSRYIGTSGCSLGWGTGAAVGVALASGDPVTLVIGDGSLRFSALGLWSIAQQNVPVTIVVLDNDGYGSTRMFERLYIEKLGPEARPQKPGYLGSDMRGSGPGVKSIIEGFGIPCHQCAPGEDTRKAMLAAWERGRTRPSAIILPVDFAG